MCFMTQTVCDKPQGPVKLCATFPRFWDPEDKVSTNVVLQFIP